MICVFCREHRRGTTEHVYGRWIRQGLGVSGRVRVVRGSYRDPDQAEAVEVELGKTTGLAITLRDAICSACNSGWLSTGLENPIKSILLPAMRGRPIDVMPSQLPLVASWAVKTALLLGLREQRLGADTFVPTSSLEWLYAHRAEPMPPPGSAVWLAAVASDGEGAPSSPAWHRYSGATSPTMSAEARLYLATFIAGALVVQVAGQDFDREGIDAGAPLEVVRVGRPAWLTPHLRLAWPHSETVSWPPPRRLRRDQVVIFGEWPETAVWQVTRATDEP